MYTQHLTSHSLPPGAADTLAEVERELGYEELVVLRQVAMQRIEKERALAEVSNMTIIKGIPLKLVYPVFPVFKKYINPSLIRTAPNNMVSNFHNLIKI